MWILRIFLALALSVVVFVQITGFLDDPPPPLNDPAIRNIITLISLFLFGFASWVWFCFVSRYPRKLRWSMAALPFVFILGLIMVRATTGRRVFTFSGSLVPRLASAERPTKTVDTESHSGSADLRTRSDHDFPQFLGPNRSGWIGTSTLNRDWQSHPPKRLWTRSIGAGWSGFAATEKVAVTMEQRGDEELITCYDVATGQRIWEHAIAARHDTTLGGTGPRSTPTIYDSHVYALGATGVLRCLNESGQLLWSDDLRGRYQLTADEDEKNVMFGRAASPLVVDELIVVPAGGPQGSAKNLIAYDRRSGEVLWESECPLPGGETDQISYASPSLAKLADRQQVLIVNESTVSGHDPITGHLLWSHPWPGRSNANASTSQAVAIDNNRVLLSKGYGGGAELLQLAESADNRIDVKSIWKVNRVLQTKFSNVVVHQGYGYALSEGILECVDVSNGKRKWKKGRYGHGQILGVGDLLLVMSEEGELHLVELNPAEFKQLGSQQILEGKSWNTLCLVGRRLLVRNAEQAACVELQ